MKSLEAIRMSKMGSKKFKGVDLMGEGEVPKANIVESDGRDFRGIKDGVKDSGPFPTAKTPKSLDIIKAASLTSGKIPKIEKYEAQNERMIGEVELGGPTEVYSPVKNYLKKKGK